MKKDVLARVEKIQREARQNIMNRGKIEFRAEPELIGDILDLAKKRKIAVGPMVRNWVSERVALELDKPETQLDTIERKLDELLRTLNQ